jgi:hypothetical protein
MVRRPVHHAEGVWFLMDGGRNVLQQLTGIIAVVAIAVLTWHGDVSGDAAVAVLGAVVGGGVVSASSHRVAEQTAHAIQNGGS